MWWKNLGQECRRCGKRDGWEPGAVYHASSRHTGARQIVCNCAKRDGKPAETVAYVGVRSFCAHCLERIEGDPRKPWDAICKCGDSQGRLAAYASTCTPKEWEALRELLARNKD